MVENHGCIIAFISQQFEKQGFSRIFTFVRALGSDWPPYLFLAFAPQSEDRATNHNLELAHT